MKLLKLASGLALLGSATGHGTLTHPTPRGHFPNQIYENDPAFVATDISNPGSAFVCRNRPAATPVDAATIVAGAPLDIRWDLSAPHVGDCAIYISYDVDLPAQQMRFFKVAGWTDCRSVNRQTLPTLMPSWLPNAEHAVLRWDWVATHVWPKLELFNQCADVRVTGGRPEGSSLPATFTIGGPPHLPVSGNEFCNPWDQSNPCGPDTNVFAPDAVDPTGDTEPPPPPPPEPTVVEPTAVEPPVVEPTVVEPPPPSTECADNWGKCAGKDFGSLCCAEGWRCNYQSEWYSQCIPARRALRRSGSDGNHRQ